MTSTSLILPVLTTAPQTVMDIKRACGLKVQEVVDALCELRDQGRAVCDSGGDVVTWRLVEVLPNQEAVV